MSKPKNRKNRRAPVVEVLEPRVLFSADSLSAIGAALLPDQNDAAPLLNPLSANFDLNNAQSDSANDNAFDSDTLLTDNSDATTNVELVFVDERVPELQSVVDDITTNKGDHVLVVVLSNTESGISAISETLAQFESVQAVHIVSHSFGDGVRLGSDILNSDSVEEHENAIAGWASSLTVNADLLLYGCELASTDNGLALMSELSLLTTADVAASANHTGHDSNGGDWFLEKSTGVIETASLVSDALQSQWDHILATWDSQTNTITIDHSDDQFTPETGLSVDRYDSLEDLYLDALETDTEISLREAVVAANNGGQAATILLTGSDYYLTSSLAVEADNDDSARTGDLDIKGDITIIGAGKGQTTIHAQAAQGVNEFRVLDYHSGVSQLTGVTITGGVVEGDGGGIRADGAQVFLTDVELKGNETLGAGIGGGLSFNAIYAEVTDVLITENKSAGDGGGAAITNATVNFTNTIVSFNTATNAAGVLAGDKSTVSMYGAIIEWNTASESGGGVGAIGGDVQLLDNSVVQNNTAAVSGGGIFVTVVGEPDSSPPQAGNAVIRNSEINNNKASTGFGGGITAQGHTSLTNDITFSTVRLERSTLFGNESVARSGGAVNAYLANLIVEDSIFDSNEASIYGGALHGTFGELWVNDSTFTLNTATRGGGLNLTAADTANINYSTFFNNKATGNGAAVHIVNGLLGIKNSTIAGNTADNLFGAISTNGSNGTVNLSNSIVANNISSNNGGVPAQNVQQLDIGVTSSDQGFNLITTENALETNIEHHFTDIIEQNLPAGYIINAGLSNALDTESLTDSHSRHLSLTAGSDAIDSGRRTDPLEYDAYGILSNEFVDIGATEYIAEAPANKIFFSSDLANANSVYRMNEDGTGLQKIIELEDIPVDGGMLEQSILDIAYDSETQQLFFIRESYTEYDVLIASADGEYDEFHRLETGGIVDSAHVQPGESYKTLALAIEQTPEGTDNILYLAQQELAPDSTPEPFQILSVPITKDWDFTNNNPAIWTPILHGDITDVRVDITMPDSTYEVGYIAALDVVRSSSGDLYISWADSDPSNSGTNNQHFVIAENGVANRAYELQTSTGDTLPNVYARDISYNPNTNEVSLLTLFASYQLGLNLPNNISYVAPTPSGSNPYHSFDQDISTETLYTTKTVDGIGVQLDASPFSWYLVDGTPEAITIAPVAPVNTPPRTPLPPEVAVAPTFSIDVDELGTAPIDNTVLLAVDEGVNGDTPPGEIIYIVRGQPVNGTLNLNGTEIWNGAMFTQEDVNQGRLTYTHRDLNTVRDPILFDIWDSVQDAPTISRTLEVNIANAPDVAVLSPNLIIPENTLSGDHVFGHVQITDLEFNSGHTIHILDADGNPHPDITVDDNNLIANKQFNYELFDPIDPTFNFYIQVENSAGALSALMEQTVTVTNVNEPPTIEGESAFSINEETYGVLLGDGFVYDADSITVEDLDSDNLQYTITQQGVAGVDVNFFYDTNDGLIKLRQNSEFDFESLNATDRTINLILRVSDQEGVPLLAQHNLTVTINDVPEDPTITGQSFVEVNENLTGSSEGIVMQSGSQTTPMTGFTITDEKYDLDPSDPNNAYTLSVHEDADPAAPASSRFAINAARQLYVIQTDGMDFETDDPTHLLYIRVTDNEGRTDTHPITVGLRDVYEPPYIEGALNFSINENADALVLNAGGTATMDPLLVQNPESAALTYSLYEIDDTDPGNEIATLSTRFSFDRITGLVSLQNGQEINYELEPGPIKLRLTVSDNITVDQHNFSIHVNDQTEAPEINGIGAVQVDENVSGFTDGVLRDTVNNNPMLGLVITDEQYDPSIPTLNKPDVIVKEVDTITLVETLSTRFAIDDNGQLYVSQPDGLDFETDPQSYLLRVEVTDAEGEIKTHDVTVTLNPVNEAPTISGNNVGYIDEDADGILRDDVTGLNPMTAVSITDPELDDPMQSETLTHNVYEVGSSTTPANERFWMGDDGLIRIRAGHEIDFETENGPIELLIESTDTAGNTDTHTFFVNVNDLTEAPEISGIGAVQVAENVSGFTDGVLRDTVNNNPMLGLVVTDEQYDPNNPTLNKPDVIVKEVDGVTESVSTRFAIDDNGQLYVSQPDGLDFETDPQSYLLRVEVTDAEGEIKTHDVTVTLNPVNEAPTISGNNVGYIDEDADGILRDDVTGLNPMTAVSITDPELDDPMQTETLTHNVYEVGSSTTPANERFWMGDDGLIRIRAGHEIDFETENGPINLRIESTDTAGNTATHLFSVNVNDLAEAPEINGIGAVQVDENVSGVTDGVLRDTITNNPMAGLVITDEQFDPNNPTVNKPDVIVKEVNAITSAETLSTRFAIDDIGQLYVSQPGGLDFENDPHTYRLRVEVTDAEGEVSFHDVTVTLNPVNEAPIISGNNVGYIDEDANGILREVTGLNPMTAVSITDPELDDPMQTETLTHNVYEVGSSTTPANERFWMGDDGLIRIRAGHEIDFETENGPINLRIESTDTAGNTATHLFSVNVNDLAEAPEINGIGAVQVAENVSGITDGVLRDTLNNNPMPALVITDEQYDPNNPLVNPYSVIVKEVDGVTESVSTRFAIDDNGQLYVSQPDGLDFETDPHNYTLRVEVTDAEGQVATRDITVQLTPINETPTIVGPKNFAITENYSGVLQGALLNNDMQSLIVDNPEAEALNYEVFEIDNSDPLNEVATLSSRFSFDNATGTISLALDSEINFEEESGPLKLELRVTDSANNVASHAFKVRIDNQPEAPIIGDSIVTAQVSENVTGVVDGVLRDTANNDPMTGLIITDEQFDPNFPDTNPYKVIVKEVDTITSVETLSTRFAIDDNGQLYVSQPNGLDFETDPQSYLLRVEVTDAENLVTTRDIAVTLNPVNEEPSISGTSSARVSENVTGPIDGILIDTSTDPHSPMIGFQVSDEEHTYDSAANPFNFTLTENGVQSNRFGIDASGVVYVNQTNGLNYEQVQGPITLTVTVTDSGGLTDSSNIEISVTNVNEQHMVDGPTNLNIKENTASILVDSDTGETMAPIVGNDPDGNTLTYELVDTGPLSLLFSLTSDNRLQANEPLNYESVIEQNPNGEIDLQVTVTDNEPGGETQTHNVVVTVVDSNDAPAHGDALSNLVATETEPFSFTVPSNTFTDEDGEIPTAYVTQANGDPLPAWIKVERNTQNELVLSGTPRDADSGITLDLIAWAEDTSNATSPAMPFQLTVESQNQAPSDIALNTVSGQMAIPELEEGFEIGTLTTVDNDASDNEHIYTIIGELNQSRFEITEDGVLKLRDGMDLDYETEQVISIDIQTDDQAGGQYIKTFEFTVLDVNEAPTVELPTAANVNENESGVVVATIDLSDAETAATDLDVTLTNADGSETTEFALSEDNEILLTAPLNHEQVSEVELAVNVSDGENTQSYPITIEVLNVNEAPSLEVLPESETQTPTITSDAPFSLSSIIISDPDVGDEPVLTIQEQGSDTLPEWLQFNAEQNTLEIVGTPDSSVSEILIDFVVDDGKGGASVETVTFSIPPQLAAAEPEPEPEPELEVVPTPVAETQPVIETVVETEPEPVVQEAEPEQTETADLATDNEIDTSLSASEIDLASLIKPLEKIALVDLSNNESTIDVIHRDINILQLDTSDFSNEWNDLETAFSQPSDIEFEDLASEFDRQREEMVEQIANTQTLIGSSFTISSGLSVGYLLWLIRGGTLMGSVLSSLPAWRLVDPLPVLGSLGDDFGEDDESLETMVQNDDPENPEDAEQTAA